MNYTTLYFDFKSRFPEAEAEEQFACLERDNLIDDEEKNLPHITFGMIVVPFVEKQFAADDESGLKRSFEFFEEMAASADRSITEVLEFTVLESLLTNESIASRCSDYLGPISKSSAARLNEYLKLP